MEKYQCSLCLLPYQDPTKIVHCNHVFCATCLDGLSTTGDKQTINCPLCRVSFDPVQDVSLDYATLDKMSLEPPVPCLGCDCTLPLLEVRSHQDFCQPFTVEQTKLVDAVRIDEEDAVPTKNRSTYHCPIKSCNENKLDQKALVQHLNDRHAKGPLVGVCPICVAMPWGDPNYICHNLVAHCNTRHQCNYSELVNFSEYEEQDEDGVLAAVLAASLLEQ